MKRIFGSAKQAGSRGGAVIKRETAEAVDYVEEKVPAAWESTRRGARKGGGAVKRGLANSWDWLEDLTGDGVTWIKRNAPHAWEAIRSGAKRVEGAWEEHSDEIGAAMDVIGRKSARGLKVVVEHDDEIMAAVAVLGIFQPQLLVVAGSYELIKPAINILTKVMNSRLEGQKVERITEEDLGELAHLARWWKALGKGTPATSTSAV